MSKRTFSAACSSIIASLGIYFIFTALSFGSTIAVGSGMAMFVAPLTFPMVYSTVLLIGFLLLVVAEFVLRRKIPGRVFLPWSLPLAMGLFGVAYEYYCNIPRVAFHDRVADRVPMSISDLNYWQQQLPGDDMFVFRFKVNPSEFNTIMARHKFDETTDSEQIRYACDEFFPHGWNRVGFSLPSERLVKMYQYGARDPSGAPHSMDVLTNEAQDTVVVMGDN